MLYPEPVSILADLVKNNKNRGFMTQCPAVKNTLKNVYAVSSAIDDYSQLDPSELKEKANSETLKEQIKTNGLIPLIKERKTSYDGYINVAFNMEWIFFASESVELKWTAPYFPASTPVTGALFSPGQMDIGSWFRSVNLDMHIPVSSTEYRIEKDQPLAFFEVMTEKRVILKRFEMTPKLTQIAKEMSESAIRYNRHMTLADRYRMAKQSRMTDIIKKEIRNNIL